MSNKRPVNIDLLTIKFPLMAISSILHRISGFLLFFFVPLFLWGLNLSLKSAQSFQALVGYLANPVLAFILWALIAALIYHLLAGIRHLLMDIGIAESLKGGRRSAQLVMVLAVILIILAGVWLW